MKKSVMDFLANPIGITTFFWNNLGLCPPGVSCEALSMHLRPSRRGVQ